MEYIGLIPVIHIFLTGTYIEILQQYTKSLEICQQERSRESTCIAVLTAVLGPSAIDIHR